MKQHQDCDRQSTAHHEAGHLVAAHRFDEAEYAEIVEAVENCGHTKYRKDLNKIEKEACVLMFLAGPAAELKYRNENSKHAQIEEIESNDIYRAKQVLGWNSYFDSDEEYIKQLIPFRKKARDFVSDNWTLICAVAERMLEAGKVTGAEIDEMV